MEEQNPMKEREDNQDELFSSNGCGTNQPR